MMMLKVSHYILQYVIFAEFTEAIIAKTLMAFAIQSMYVYYCEAEA